jgi:hypothetical protein
MKRPKLIIKPDVQRVKGLGFLGTGEAYFASAQIPSFFWTKTWEQRGETKAKAVRKLWAQVKKDNPQYTIIFHL